VINIEVTLNGMLDDVRASINRVFDGYTEAEDKDLAVALLSFFVGVAHLEFSREKVHKIVDEAIDLIDKSGGIKAFKDSRRAPPS